MVDMFRRGMTRLQIAEEMGVTLQHVIYVTKESGPKHPTVSTMYHKGARMGAAKKEFSRLTVERIRKNLRGNETMLACVSRMIEGMED